MNRARVPLARLTACQVRSARMLPCRQHTRYATLARISKEGGSGGVLVVGTCGGVTGR